MEPAPITANTTCDKLLEIRLNLEPYHTAYCGLKHERVTEFYRGEAGEHLKRYGFCDKASRRYRIGCAHTGANDEFRRIVSSAAGYLPNAQVFSDEFEQLFLNVYMMDVAKGVLEKQLAFACHADNSPLIATAKAAIAEVIATHCTLIDAVEDLRLKVMANLFQA